MKRPASILVACVGLAAVGWLAAGCSARGPNAASPPAVGGNDHAPRGGTVPPASLPPTPHRPYPLVLAHGFSGFHNIGPLTYFYGVEDALRKDGHQVHVTQVDPYNSSEVRGTQLQAQVEHILTASGATKINLVCHSQGALDCRYVAHQLGARIAAVVLVAGVNRGSYIADVAAGIIKGPAADAVAALLELFGEVVLDPEGNPDSDAKAAIAQLTGAGADQFNARYPDDPRVAYFSIAGRSAKNNGDLDCGSQTTAPFLGRWDGITAAVNPLLAPTAAILDGSAAVPPTHDGLVSVASARWGTFLGCVPADHLSEVCQIAGQSSGSRYDCVTMYRDLAAWLVAHGF
jgi:triacylglycerol lipase